MKKTFVIAAAILFIVAVVVGKFAKFDAAVPVTIGVGAFSFAALVAGAVQGAKEKNAPTWQIVVVVVGSTVGGVLFFVGNASQDIMQQISGLVIAILGVIGGLLFVNNKEVKTGN